MKLAIVDDYLNQFGGAAQVVAAVHEAFPEAPIYTIYSNIRKGGSDPLSLKFQDAKIIPSWFDRLPFRERLMSPLLFLVPLIWAGFDFSEFDLVISSASWAVTKGFARGKTREICYCHTPPRYLYGYDVASGRYKKYWPVRVYAALVAHFMRLYDFARAQKVTQFVANSREVAARIRKFYRRESIIIYPPVESPGREIIGEKRQDYFLTGGRLEKTKNFDLIVRVCSQLEIPLKVFGQGKEGKGLRTIAGKTVEFVGPVSEEEKSSLLARARAFIVAATDEDFGITPVEAMAAGTPVIAFRGGGYLETVVEGKTGIFFDELTAGSLTGAIRKLQGLKFSSGFCRARAEEFSKDKFIQKMRQLVYAGVARG